MLCSFSCGLSKEMNNTEFVIQISDAGHKFQKQSLQNIAYFFSETYQKLTLNKHNKLLIFNRLNVIMKKKLIY